MERLPDDAWRWWRHRSPVGHDRVQIRGSDGQVSILSMKEASPYWNVQEVQWRPVPKPKLVHNRL